MSKTLFQSVLIIAGFSVLTRFLGFLFRIYLSRELGAELLGVYQVAFSVFMVLIVIVSSGIPLAVSKSIAKYNVEGKNKQSGSMVASALIVGLAISIALCGIFLLFYQCIGALFADPRCIYILISLLPAVVCSAVYSAFRGALWGVQDYFNVSLAELIEQVLRIAIFALMAEWIFTSLDGAMVAGISMSVACVLSALFVVIVYFRKGNRLASPRICYKPLIKSAAPVTGVRVASSLIQPIIAVLFPAMLVLAGYTSEQAMEAYGMAMGMTFPLLFLPSTIVGALSFALIPDLSAAIAQKNDSLVRSRITTSLSFALFVSALIIPFYIGCGEAIGLFLYDNAGSGVYLSRSAWVMIPLGLSNITSSILNAFNLEVKSFVNNILGGVLLLGFVVCASGALGVDALIWGFGACMTITTILNLFMLKRHTKLNFMLLKPLFLMILFIIPASLLAKWVYGLMLLCMPNVVALGLGAAAGCGSFAILCWLFKLVDITSVLLKINLKKHKKSTKTA